MSSPKRSDWTVNVRRLDAPQIPDRPFLVEVRRPNGGIAFAELCATEAIARAKGEGWLKDYLAQTKATPTKRVYA